jgi:hypothetical protein
MGKKNRGNTSNKAKQKAAASTAPKPVDSGPVAAHAQDQPDAPASTAGPSSPIPAKGKHVTQRIAPATALHYAFLLVRPHRP